MPKPNHKARFRISRARKQIARAVRAKKSAKTHPARSILTQILTHHPGTSVFLAVPARQVFDGSRAPYRSGQVISLPGPTGLLTYRIRNVWLAHTRTRPVPESEAALFWPTQRKIGEYWRLELRVEAA